MNKTGGHKIGEGEGQMVTGGMTLQEGANAVGTQSLSGQYGRPSKVRRRMYFFRTSKAKCFGCTDFAILAISALNDSSWYVLKLAGLPCLKIALLMSINAWCLGFRLLSPPQRTMLLCAIYDLHHDLIGHQAAGVFEN